MVTQDFNRTQFENKTFELQIERLPSTTFFSTSVQIPGVSVNAIPFPTPFTDLKIHGDKMIFQPLIVNFQVNEDLSNWYELFKWIVSYAHPTEFGEYKDSVSLQQLYNSKRSQATLLIKNNKYNASKEFVFEDLIPIDLSEIFLDTQQSDVEKVSATATFEYTNYYLRS